MIGWSSQEVVCFAGSDERAPDDPSLRRADPSSRMATRVAAALAERGACDAPAADRTGLYIVRQHGAVAYCERFLEQFHREGARAVSPFLFSEAVPNAPAAHVSRLHGMARTVNTVIGSRTAALQALALAADDLEAGEVDRAMVIALFHGSPLLTSAYDSVFGSRGGPRARPAGDERESAGGHKGRPYGSEPTEAGIGLLVRKLKPGEAGTRLLNAAWETAGLGWRAREAALARLWAGWEAREIRSAPPSWSAHPGEAKRWRAALDRSLGDGRIAEVRLPVSERACGAVSPLREHLAGAPESSGDARVTLVLGEDGVVGLLATAQREESYVRSARSSVALPKRAKP